MLRVLIVDDEGLARLSLRVILEENFAEEVSIVAEAENLADAVLCINRFQPDLVFLDIDMPEQSGLDLFQYFPENEMRFNVVFATAYSEYALRAIELAAMDYLLKPISLDALRRVVERAFRRRESPTTSFQLLRDGISITSPISSSTEQRKIAVNTSDGIVMLPLRDIIYIKADGSYSYVFLQNRTRIMLSKRLADFERLELTNDFLRLHRSYIVNLHFIQKITRQYEVILESGEIINISEDKRRRLNEWINTQKL